MASAADAPFGYVEVDARGSVVDVNDDATRRLARPRHELVGASWQELLTRASRMIFQSHVLPMLGAQGFLDEIYLSLVAGGGLELPVVLNARRRTVDGGFVDLLAFAPMSRRTLFDEEFAQAQRTAERSMQSEQQARQSVAAIETRLAVAERLASVGTLAAGVAHEINNPLSYVAMNLEMIEAELGERPAGELREMLRDAHMGVERIQQIVGSMKSLSRLQEQRREPVALARIVEVAVKIAGSQVRLHARLEVDVREPGPVVMGDEGELAQVAINLLVNSAHALARGDPARSLVRVTTGSDGDRAWLEVVDNGPGVPASLERRIFDPFFTTKVAGEGTGLGLSVCLAIVTGHGGTLGLERPPDGGASFRVTLPLALADATVAAPPRETPAAGSAPALLPRRILVVDDEEPVRRALSRTLRGCDVVLCEDGVDALSRLEAEGFTGFDAILCDLTMPRMNGEELHEALQARSPEMSQRMVFVTGGTLTAGARLFLERVPNARLPKPFTRKELFDVLDGVARTSAATCRGSP